MIKKYIPLFLRDLIRPFFEKYRMRKVQNAHKKALFDIKTKDSIKVAFLVIYESMWKYDQLYLFFKNDTRFEPVIFICPFLTFGKSIMTEEMERAYIYFSNKGYHTIKTLQTDGSYLDIKKEFNPDLIFFTNPWQHSKNDYLISNFLDRLTCYVPYGFKNANMYQEQYNTDMHKLCWKVFSETDFDKELAIKFADNKGRNIVVTGYPGIDNLIDSSYSSKFNVWKVQETRKKRIIWAPHHTIDIGQNNSLNYSTFLSYAYLMLELAQNFQDEIQICFKPHPNLRGKLNRSDVWGKVETDKYYSTWDSLSNGQLDEGSYIDLFLQSDALIHDSSSFVLEYLFVNKPVMFLIGDEKVYDQFNKLGRDALCNVEQGFSKEDIISFVQNVIDNIDKCFVDRKRFVKENLMPPKNKLASENIYNYLTKEIFN